MDSILAKIFAARIRPERSPDPSRKWSRLT